MASAVFWRDRARLNGNIAERLLEAAVVNRDLMKNANADALQKKPFFSPKQIAQRISNAGTSECWEEIQLDLEGGNDKRLQSITSVMSGARLVKKFCG
ncbi:MAG TPA: hypothetical protein VM553_06950 [Dongiaceae bacterium]|nr:hypothetical protein [Dongiaceae bacterium]